MVIRKKPKLELRYYEVSNNEPLLALLGDGWKRNYGNDTALKHFHNLLEIGYCHYGSGELVLHNSSYEFKGGMLSVIPKNYYHTTKSKEDSISYWEYLFVDVENFLRVQYEDKPLLYKEFISRINQRAIFVESSEYPAAARLILAIMEEMRNKKEFYRESVKCLLHSLLIELTRMNPQRGVVKLPEAYSFRQLEVALDYINLNYEKSIRISELSDMCHISETHFRRIFVNTINMTPLEYINLVRVQKACDLIKSTDYSMEEIAVKVGFSIPSTFNRNFKTFVGNTPFQWRNITDNYDGNLVNYRISVHKGW